MNSFYIVKVQGKNPDYFLHKLIHKNIKIYHLEKKYDSIIIKVCPNDFLKIKEIKTTYQVSVIGREGILYYQYLLKKYFIFLICFLLGIFINIFLSCLILDVEVVHTNEKIRNLVYQDLEELGIKKYHFKVDYKKKEEIEKKILKKEVNDLEWIEIEEIGTKYQIKVEQRKKDSEKEVCNPRHIVAKKKAMILDVDAEEGEVVTKRLDYVDKGDILISGFIYNKEEVMAKKCAVGKVFGEVWYQVEVELPKNYHEENVTGKEKSTLEFQFLNYEYSLFSHFKTYKKQITPILSSKILPIELRWVRYLETKVTDTSYDLDTVDSEALKIASLKMKTKLGKEDSILTKKVLKKYEKESRIIVEVFIKVKEDITDYQDISDVDISKLNEKKEE